MPHAAHPTIDRWFSRLWSRRYTALGCLVCLFAVALLVRAGTRHWRLRQELNHLRLSGDPVTAEELLAVCRVPYTVANATASWRRPLDAIRAGALRPYPHGIPLIDRTGTPPRAGELWPDFDKAKGFLAKHDALMNDIDAALSTPGECSYLADFSEGYMTMLPHVDGIRPVDSLLLLRAYVRAHAGEGDAAIADIAASIQVMETLKREPFIVSQSLRLVSHRDSLSSLAALLPRIEVTEAALVDLQTRLSEINYHPSLRLVVDGERVAGLTAFGNPSTAGAGKTPIPIFRAMVGDDEASYLAAIRNFAEAAREDWPVPIRRTAGYAPGTFDAMDRKLPLLGTWSAPSGIIGPLRTLVERMAQETARMRAAVVGIAAVRFREETGRWPESFAELTPKWLDEAPLDPFTGDPLKLKAKGDSLCVYSVGLNGKDDGGTEDSVTNKDGWPSLEGKPDVGFTLSD
jgi:hypothetical protein